MIAFKNKSSPAFKTKLRSVFYRMFWILETIPIRLLV